MQFRSAKTWSSIRTGRFGFPGEQKEYEMAMEFLQPAFDEARYITLRIKQSKLCCAELNIAQHSGASCCADVERCA